MYRMLFQRALAPVALTSLGLAAQAQIAISELLLDPVGPDAGRQVVELHNTLGQPIDLASFRLCAAGVDALPAGCSDLPAVLLPAGWYVRVHWGEAGLDDAWDVHTGVGVDTLPLPVGSLSLLATETAEIVDFVQWGGNAHGVAGATRQGQWTYDTWVETPAEKVALAYDGAGESAHDWFHDSSHTLGLANTLPGAPHVETYGVGCTGSFGAPVIGTDYGPPALGNLSFTVTASSALPGAPAGFGLSPHAAAIHLGDCLFLVDLAQGGFTVLGLQTVSPLGVAAQPLPVPNMPVLIGEDFFVQAIVIDPDASTGYAFTDGLEIEL